jgi:hypothetical protein
VTTREIQQRHREAALALTDDVAFSRENPQLQAWLKGEAGAPIGCLAEVDLSDVAELLANAELPAPSAPAAFDPWEALHEAGYVLDSTMPTDRDQRRKLHVGLTTSAGSTWRECALSLCRKLGIAESPQGKEST